MTYYLKYRPQSLGELDQDNVRETLTKLVRSGEIPHALLFSGPKGTGKTSAARILAKIVNCESPKGTDPCNDCQQCISIAKGQNLDVIELDAASHRGIEDIRQIRDAVKLAPARAKKKVYIIDEAHMLTTEASNALLKTLEEPPEHVMFILATTNPEKLIDTIRSRVTNIVFKKASSSEITKSLEKIARGENVKVGGGVFEVIADASGGSFRDATKIFEQLVSEGTEFKKEIVEDILSVRKSFDVSDFLHALYKKDTRKALSIIDMALQKGAVAKDITGAILDKLRGQLLIKVNESDGNVEGFNKADLITLVKLFSEAYPKIQYAFIEQIPLEIAIIEWCEKSGPKLPQTEALSESSKEPQRTGETGKPGQKTSVDNRAEENDQTYRDGNGDEMVSDVVENAGSNAVSILTGTMSDDVWRKVLGSIKPGHASTEALLRAARPLEFNGSILKIGVYYKFHKEHLEEAHHREILEKALSSYLGNSVRVVCTLTEPPVRKLEETVTGNGNHMGEDDIVLTEPKSEDVNVKSSLTSNSGEDIISIAEKIFSE